MNFKHTLYLLSFCLLVCSCNSKDNEQKDRLPETPRLFSLLDPQDTGFDFTNAITNSKDFNIFKYRNFYNGGGVAIGDINNEIYRI